MRSSHNLILIGIYINTEWNSKLLVIFFPVYSTCVAYVLTSILQDALGGQYDIFLDSASNLLYCWDLAFLVIWGI